MQKYFISLSIFCFSFFISNAQISDSDSLLTISNQAVLANEFVRVYNKNLNLVQDASQKDLDSYLELFINYKLKLVEAKNLDYDKDPTYLKEFSSYKNQLTDAYLTDKKVTDALVREAYERTNNEVKALSERDSLSLRYSSHPTWAFLLRLPTRLVIPKIVSYNY